MTTKPTPPTVMQALKRFINKAVTNAVEQARAHDIVELQGIVTGVRAANYYTGKSWATLDVKIGGQIVTGLSYGDHITSPAVGNVVWVHKQGTDMKVVYRLHT